MKNLKLIILFSLFGVGLALAQQAPTISNPSNGGVNDINFWSRAGNNNNPNGSNGNNIFGTRWESPIYFITGGLTAQTYRMKLNGPYSSPNQYPINTYVTANGVNTTGYLLIGQNNNSITDNRPMYTTANGKGAFSLLHLNGEGSGYQEFGYRPWMKTGVTFTANRDLSYVGLRKLSTTTTEEDLTEMTIAWSDNASAPHPGPDDMVFRFMGSGAGTTVGADFTSNNDLDGLHIARFTGEGQFGLGNTFGTNATGMSVGYVRPQSLMHLSLNGTREVWQQFSNQEGTGQAATDGLRIGIANIRTAYIYNQENAPLLFSTNSSTTTQLARERMRLTHVGEPGMPNTTVPNNFTRLAISLNPAVPLTAPRSLVHIGSPLQGGFQSTDGTRDWMNVGYLATDSSDNMYVGLKREGVSDRLDAVLAWGDNQTDQNGDGPDNLRFIFTSTQALLVDGTTEARSDNGQEIARFTPACATCPVNTGSLGIGNYSPGSANAPGTATYVGATLDVDGDARIRNVAQRDTLNQILVRDPNDLGRIHWRDASTFTGGGAGAANNGLSLNAGTVQLGATCGNALAAILTNDREIPMDKFNLIFSGQHITGARIGIGLTANCTPGAKVDIRQFEGSDETTLSALNKAPLSPGGLGIGSAGYIETGDATTCETMAIAGFFGATSSARNVGVLGYAEGDNSQGCNTSNYGGYFLAQNGAGGNTALYAEADVTAGNLAAFINGDGVYTTTWTFSDAQLKQGIVPLQDASQALLQLNPVTYTFNPLSAPSLNLPQGLQFGVLAQELQTVFPQLVKKVNVPKKVPIPGSLFPAINTGPSEISVVNYEGLIPVLIAAFQEQNERIDQLQAQLNACCNAPRSMETEGPDMPTGAVIQTRLQNMDEPTLGQNIPNPFETDTRIPVYLPQAVGKANLLFYGNDGRVLQTVQIAERGNVTVDVNSEALASGIYSYTLFTDGRPVETRKMIKR